MLIAIALAGCALSGNVRVRDETSDTVASKVTKGVTTEAQVKVMFGEPSDVSLTDQGSEVWKYVYAHATAKPINFVPIVGLFAGGADGTKNELVFIFDSQKVLLNYTVHASEMELTRNLASYSSTTKPLPSTSSPPAMTQAPSSSPSPQTPQPVGVSEPPESIRFKTPVSEFGSGEQSIVPRSAVAPTPVVQAPVMTAVASNTASMSQPTMVQVKYQGLASSLVEQSSCSSHPHVELKLLGSDSEIYTAPCDNGNNWLIKCEAQKCHVMQ
jgi:outer membrane protein assembly factor BamE (lipoprotein component of BamABCDE complex)